MKLLIFATYLGLSLFGSLSLAKDCATSKMDLRKVSSTSSNLTAQQWVCAAAYQVPFEDRDQSPVVDKCIKSSVLYREVTVDRSVACEVLLMANGTRHFVQNRPVSYGWEPVYQSTLPGPNDAN